MRRNRNLTIGGNPARLSDTLIKLSNEIFWNKNPLINYKDAATYGIYSKFVFNKNRSSFSHQPPPLCTWTTWKKKHHTKCGAIPTFPFFFFCFVHLVYYNSSTLHFRFTNKIIIWPHTAPPTNTFRQSSHVCCYKNVHLLAQGISPVPDSKKNTTCLTSSWR